MVPESIDYSSMHSSGRSKESPARHGRNQKRDMCTVRFHSDQLRASVEHEDGYGCQLDVSAKLFQEVEV